MPDKQKNIKILALLGHQKGGTRYLMGAIKESGIFAILSHKEIISLSLKQRTSRDKINSSYVYADHPTALSEKDPVFLIKELYPNAQALVMYRNPVDAMISMHKYLRGGKK